MKILLDTQCFLWMAGQPEKLSPETRAIVSSTSNELFLSAGSAWEIAIKYALGKLRLPQPPERFVPTRVDRLRAVPLAIEHDHALRVTTLPPHHRDPFDRILVAQAQLEQLRLLTADPVFGDYDVDILDA